MRTTRRNRTPKADRKPAGVLLKRYKDNAVCKNAIFVMEKLKDFAIEVKVNKGCKNLRRNGSAWCVDCAKEYHDGKK